VTPYDKVPNTFYRGDANDLGKRKRLYEEIVAHVERYGGKNNPTKGQSEEPKHEGATESTDQFVGDIGRPRYQYRNDVMREIVLTLYYQGGNLNPVSRSVAKRHNNYKNNYGNVPDKFRRYMKREILDDFMVAVSNSDVHEAIAFAALMPIDIQKKIGVTPFKF
jgi:hypothetical protein